MAATRDDFGGEKREDKHGLEKKKQAMDMDSLAQTHNQLAMSY